MKKFKRLFLLYVFICLLCIGVVGFGQVQAAGKSKVKLNSKSTTLTVGKTKTLKLSGVKGKVKWLSSNSKVVKITKKKGKYKNSVVVKALKSGSATITAKYKGKKYKCKVKVKKVTSNSNDNSTNSEVVVEPNWYLNKSSMSLECGRLEVNTLCNADKNVVWVSSNEKVVRIRNTFGVNNTSVTLEANYAGIAIVTAKCDGREYKCTVSVKVNANHVHDLVCTVITEPTCTTQGSEKGLCKDCGYEVVVTLGALGHDYNCTIITEPTCTESGLEKRVCNRCGLVENEVVLPPLGHDLQYGVDYKLSLWYYHVKCTRCDYGSTEHTFGDMRITQEPTTSEHGWGEKSCSCGAVERWALHLCEDWKYYDEEYCLGKKCQVCGQDVLQPHIFDSTGKCINCGYDRVNKN